MQENQLLIMTNHIEVHKTGVSDYKQVHCVSLTPNYYGLSTSYLTRISIMKLLYNLHSFL